MLSRNNNLNSFHNRSLSLSLSLSLLFLHLLQMESYKKKATDSVKQIKLLEAKNIELQQLFGSNSNSQATPSHLPPPPKSAGGGGNREGGSYLKRHSNGGASTPTNKSSRQGLSLSSLLDWLTGPGFSEPLVGSPMKQINPVAFMKQMINRLITAHASR
jgi:hypothetical protein